MKRYLIWAVAASTAACGGRSTGDEIVGAVAPAKESASRAEVDSLWNEAVSSFRQGKWGDAITDFERLTLELPSGDPRIPRTQFFLGESYLGRGDQLQAARHFRRVSDDFPDDSLASDALIRVGDAYAELWRRPELDPTYGRTALATYQEVVNRYPGGEPATRAQARIIELQERFAFKEYKSALFYLRLKAYDSAIIYLKSLVASYPKTHTAPLALVRLVQAYQKLGYEEDVRETCDYIRRFHPSAEGVGEVCPRAPPPPPGAS